MCSGSKRSLDRYDMSLRSDSMSDRDRRRGQEMRRADRDAVKAEARRRGIRALYHFTAVGNLPSIAEKGLLSRARLADDPAVLINDADRFDGFLDYIALSVSQPNTRLLYTFATANRERGYAIIEIYRSVLWTRGNLFTWTNAAAGPCLRVPRKELQGSRAFSRLFADRCRTANGSVERTSDHLPKHPTDSQAEVLVPESIGTRRIRCVHFYNLKRLVKFLTAHPQFDLPVCLSPGLFEADHGH